MTATKCASWEDLYDAMSAAVRPLHDPSRAVPSGSPAAAAREASDSPAPGAGLRPGAGPSTEGGRS